MEINITFKFPPKIKITTSKESERVFRSFWFLAFIILVAITLVFATFTFVASFIDDPLIDVTSVPNVGFLMLIALANGLFSWGRSIEPERKIEIKRINNIATHALFSSIFFIVSSFFLYLKLNKENGILDASPLGKDFDRYLLAFTGYVSLIIAIITTLFIFLKMAAIYLRLEYLDELDETKEEDKMVEDKSKSELG